jgi:hypothetical protein
MDHSSRLGFFNRKQVVDLDQRVRLIDSTRYGL